MRARLAPDTVLTRRGWAFLAAGGAALLLAWLLGRRDLLVLAVFLAALPGAAVVLLRLVRPVLHVSRQFSPAVVEAGTPATVHLTVSARQPPPAPVRMREGLPARFGESPVFRFPPALQQGRLRAGYEYRLRSSRRGLYLIGPATAAFLDPFGLAQSVRKLGGADPLIVVPAPLPLPPPLPLASDGPDGTVVHARPGGPTEDEASTRGYRPGDPMRRVHWSATARHGQLMVRQEQPIATPWATLLLDRREAAHGHRSVTTLWEGSEAMPTSESFEWAVTAAVSAAAHLIGGGWALTALDQAGRPLLLGSASSPDGGQREEFMGSAGLQDFAEGLAALGLQVSGSDEALHPGYGRKLADRLAEVRSPGPLIAVPGELSPADAAALAPLAEPSGQAFALLTARTPRGCADSAAILRSAGWTVAVATPDVPVPLAWSRLGGAARSGRAGGAAPPAGVSGSPGAGSPRADVPGPAGTSAPWVRSPLRQVRR